MNTRAVVAAVACAALTLSGKAAAEPPPQIAFRLDYQVNLPGRGCPNVDEFGLILAGEFGYLLVRDDAAALLRVETRTNGKGIEAELSAPNPAEEGEWRRVVTSPDCRELLYDAATLIRIRFGPGGWRGEKPPPWLLNKIDPDKRKERERCHRRANEAYAIVFDDARPSETVLLRVGAPEEKDPSDWVLPFEILGPGERRIERAFHAVDAVQSLQWGLQMIALELRSLQHSAGGKLHFLDEESLGFDPLNLP